jgi:predicted DNA-binding transcriptional regulator YafY
MAENIILPAFTAGRGALVVSYTNHRGETSVRRLEPVQVWFGSTQWHHEPQWFLNARDLDKREYRDFALRDMRPAEEQQN